MLWRARQAASSGYTLIATGVNAEATETILGIQAASAEDGQTLWRSSATLVARGLSGVALVTSDAHAACGRTAPPACSGLGSAAEPTTHNLMAATEAPSWPWVHLPHPSYDQPDAELVVASNMIGVLTL